MLALAIPDIRPFTEKLFLQDAFDHFYLTEASFTTFTTFMIDGHLQQDYFDSEEWTQKKGQTYACWRQLKPHCFQLIKGRRLPVRFRLIFKLTENNVQKLIDQSGLTIPAEAVGGLFLNIKYENHRLECISGTSFKQFFPDKSLEYAWDNMIKRIFRQHQLVFEEK